MEVDGTADPVELRHLAEAWPEDIFPTPPEERQAKDAAAAHVLRRMAVPHFLACADEIEWLRHIARLAGDVLDQLHPDVDWDRVPPWTMDTVDRLRDALARFDETDL